MWALHVLTYEIDDDDGRSVPTVEHTFFGKTQAEAEHVASSHRKTDSFFRGCGTARERTWHGIRCYSESWWEQT